MKANIRIRTEIMKSNLKNHEVGSLMGLTETAFSRKLRTELPDDEQERIIELIRNYTKGGQDNE